jgi:hypothetical protein
MAGYTGLLAPWIGGASAPQPGLANGGYRSLLAFWAGGASASVQPAQNAAGVYWQVQLPQFDEEDEALLLCGAIGRMNA